MSTKEQSLIPKVFTHESFGKLRVVVIDGVIYFVAVDVARALGYQNPQRAIRSYVDPQDKRSDKVVTPGGLQVTLLISKSGVYSLILDSQMPKAKEYRHWVTSEVLPTINEKGSYSAVEASPAPLALPEAKDTQRLNTRVYAFLMNDNSVKIGYTDRLCPRISEIKREKNSAVKDIYFSPLMSRENARLVERCCKEIFSSSKLDGEFFSVKFEEACKAIDSFVKMVAAPAINSDLKRGGKIFKVAKRNIIEHANLLADKNPD